MASLLIIGGSGFFGKSILDAYKRGILKCWNIDHIFILARNPESLRVSFPELLGPSVTLIKENIVTCEILPKADFVIHAAASTEVKNYLLHPKEEQKNITSGVQNYCRLALSFHHQSRIVFVSSGAVYGKKSNQLSKIAENDLLMSLKSMPEAKRGYASAKRDAEALMHDLGRQGVKVSIARCFSFIGPYLPRDQHFAIGNFINDAFNGDLITVKSKQAVFRSYMHADDLVVWLMTIASEGNFFCPIFNVGSDEAISISDLACLVASRLNKQVSIPAISNKSVDWYVPSIDKARSKLHLKIQYNLLEAIDRTILQLMERSNARPDLK